MKILCPLPTKDFDPSEVAIPWLTLTKKGHELVFATPKGVKALTDMRMITGDGLGPFKSTLIAEQKARDTYYECVASHEFNHPINYISIKPEKYDALLLPGGHDKGMKEYLESSLLQDVVVQFFDAKKPVAAICHGTLLAARSIHPKTNKSVLYGKVTTGLTFTQELIAWLLTFLWRGDYYRTYPQFLEHELKSLLKKKSDFKSGPLPLKRDQADNFKAGFIVRDENYLSARWPGDVHKFSNEFLSMIENGKGQ